jgi:DNA-binding beta-propeller fold protein YncE
MYRNNPRINSLLVGMLAAGLSLPAFAQSVQFPTYSVGENLTGSHGPSLSNPTPNPWVASSGQILTPAGTQVYLGVTTRAKAIALNPLGNHTAAVLQMSAPQAVTIFNTQTGAVLQNVKTPSSTGSATGIAYTSDGAHLLFSQDSHYVAYLNISTTTGLFTTEVAQISVPKNLTATTAGCFAYTAPYNTAATPPSGSPPGTSGGSGNSAVYNCGTAYSGSSTSYPLGLAVDPANAFAYSVADVNDTLAQINLSTHAVTTQLRVGQVPHSVVISADGKTAYVSNEGGRVPAASDFQEYSDGTPVVATYPTGATATGTVSVVNLSTFTKTTDITVGLHPTAMAFWGSYLLVANTYGDSISVVNTSNNLVAYTIHLALPIAVPGSTYAAFGAGPNSIAVDQANNIAYVALYNANAIAVVNLVQNAPGTPIMGMIPVGYAPSSVVLDQVAGDNDVLLVANDKGIGTTGFVNTPAENSTVSAHGVGPSLNTHEDLGTVSIVPVPTTSELRTYTKQVYYNNHWDLAVNINSASGGNPSTPPVPIPAKIGAPSLIKHVFVIIRENRTYDQMLGDVVGGNGDPALAIFGDGSVAQTGSGGAVSPNAHALVERFPLFDNFYDPSRQSADGHNWILQAMAPYSDDIQSPDWVRDYPSNGGDAIAYQPKGHIYDVAAAAGIKMKNYGEYVEYDLFNTPTNLTSEPPWNDWYRDTSCFDAQTFGSNPNYALPTPSDCQGPASAGETTLYYQNTVTSWSPLPNVQNYTVTNYPQFDLTIPDQFRFDIWWQDFQKDVASNSVPQLEFMWISSDHTGTVTIANAAQQADNDLAVGRFVDAISHSNIWSSSVIFVEEDDAQDGVDHVDGHRSPGYVISPYVKQKVNADGTGAGVTEDSTFYTQVNFTRTIEQILGLKPMNQYDLVASPMSEIFINNVNSPSQLPAYNLLPWNHLQNDIALDKTANGVLSLLRKTNPKAAVLAAGWLKKKKEIFAGNEHRPDVEDPDTVRHFTWYEATGYVIPYPGEKTVRPASEFNRPAPNAKAEVDD